MSMLEIQGIENAIADIEMEIQRIISEVIEPGMKRAWEDLLAALQRYMPQYTRNAYNALQIDLSDLDTVRIWLDPQGPYDQAPTDYILRIRSPHTMAHPEYPGYLHDQQNVYTNADALPMDEWVRKALYDIGIRNAQREADCSYSGDITDDFKARYFGGLRTIGFAPPFIP